MNIKITGGAKIGNSRASWPFVTLSATHHVLIIDGGLIGSVAFRPQDVTAVDTIENILVIKHTVKEYKKDISFTSFQNATDIAKQLQRVGFLFNPDAVSPETDKLVKAMQQSGQFPIRKMAAIAIIAIWNILILLPLILFATGNVTNNPLGEIFTYAPGFMLILCILLLTVKPVQQLILKEGRSAEGGLRITLFFMIAMFTMFIVAGQIVAQVM